MRHPRPAFEPFFLVLSALCLAFGTGCVTLGKAGVLGFDYEARDRLLGRSGPGNAALAVGGYVNLNVYSRMPPPAREGDGADGLGGATRAGGPGGFDPVEVLRAWSSIPEVARLDAPAGRSVRVHGVSAGQADVSVESALGGDSVVVSVAEVESATLEHWLAGVVGEGRFTADTAFVQGGTGRFLLSMRDASGRAVVGAGVVPPITVAPAGAARVAAVAEGDLRHAEIRFDLAGPVELGMRRRDPLRAQVIEAASVTALAIVTVELTAGVAPLPAGVRQGRGIGAAVRGVLADGRRALLLGDVARVTSATPDVCATPADPTERARLVLGDGVTAVDAAAPGTCTLVATLGALRAEATFPVEPAAQPAPPAPAAPAAGTSPSAIGVRRSKVPVCGSPVSTSQSHS